MTLDGIVPASAAAFALASLLIELTPGPNMTWLVLVAVEEGRRAALSAVAGVALGLSLIGAIAALGVAEVVQSSPVAYEVLRWAGIAFLLYLAWDGWRGEPGEEEADGRRYFLRGFMANVLNPKAFIFYIAVLPAFVDRAGAIAEQTYVLTAIYVAIATGVHFTLVMIGGALRPYLNRPETEKRLRRVLAVALALIALWFAWSTAR